MAFHSPIPAPPIGTASALTETKNNVDELVKLGVSDNNDYTQAGGMLKHVKHNLKKLEEFEEAEKRPLLDDLNKIRERYKPMRDSWLSLEKTLKSQMERFNERQRLKHEEAQRKLLEAAAAERAKLQKQADKASASGKHERAAMLSDQAAAVVAPVIANEAPKVAGISTVETWDCEVTEPDKVPLEYRPIDIKLLKKAVKLLKSAASAIPGIRVFKVSNVRSTAEQPEV